MLKQAFAMFACLGLTLGAAQAGDGQPEPADYAVFVDPPTGFVFVKLPAGWKFVGRVDGHAVARLPDRVITWLLPEEEDPTRLAGLGRPMGEDAAAAPLNGARRAPTP